MITETDNTQINAKVDEVAQMILESVFAECFGSVVKQESIQ